MYYSTKELWRLRLSACWRQQTYPAAVEGSWGGGGEERREWACWMWSSDRAAPRIVDLFSPGLLALLCGSSVSTAALRSVSRAPSLLFGVHHRVSRLCWECFVYRLHSCACAICCLPPRRSWHSCVELFIICLFVFFKSEFWEEAGIVVPEFISPLTPNGKLCCASPCKVDWAPSSLPQTFSLKNLYSWFFFRVFRHFKVSGSGYLLVSPHLIDAFQIKGRGGEKKSLSFAFAVTLFWIIVFNIGGTHRGIHLQLGYTNKCLLQTSHFLPFQTSSLSLCACLCTEYEVVCDCV